MLLFCTPNTKKVYVYDWGKTNNKQKINIYPIEYLHTDCWKLWNQPTVSFNKFQHTLATIYRPLPLNLPTPTDEILL
jgi:hypothetical protein